MAIRRLAMFRSNTLPTRREALARCALAALIPLVCAVVLTAALVERAPIAVMPLIVLVCVGYPMVTAFELPLSLAVLGATRSDSRVRRGLSRLRRRGEVRTMRKQLDEIPETRHPLGL